MTHCFCPFPAGVQNKIALLQPLADLSESTRSDLLKTLRELLKDGDDLVLLERTVRKCSSVNGRRGPRVSEGTVNLIGRVPEGSLRTTQFS